MACILYIRGDLSAITGTVTPGTTESWVVECWGAGSASFSDGTGGWAADYVKETALAVTKGTGVSISIGAPAQTFDTAGGDTWVGSSATVFAQGGNHFVTNVGDVHNAGAAGGVSTGVGRSGGGGAGGPAGAGSAGAAPGTSTNVPGSGGGAANGGGVGGVSSSTVGGVGGGTGGGAGGTSGTLQGAPGAPGKGGGGAYGVAGSGYVGGDGGDDWDNGGGGGGGAGNASPFPLSGNGGTPGGGGGGGTGSFCGRGGFGLIKITIPGAEPLVSLVGGGVWRMNFHNQHNLLHQIVPLLAQ